VILVLRALGIGDLATAVPALRGLRAAFPGRTVALAAPGWLAPLADLVDAVDQLVPVGELAPVPVECPYWAVNLHGRGPQSHRLLQATEPATLCAFACSAAGHLDGPLWIEEEHEVARWCRLLRWYGIAADPDDLALLRPPAGTMPVGATVVHPGAKDAARRWPVERFAAVARTLARRGHRVVVTGSVADAPAAAEVVRRAGLPPSAVLASGTVGELAAVIAHARLLVSGDTGAAHLATAYRTPSLVLFGSMPPHRWGPPPERAEHRSLWHDELAWLPAGAGPHPALRAITVDEVLAAADQLSRQLSRSG
jgi:ADP-heptose:LPS heptosyltransferase